MLGASESRGPFFAVALSCFVSEHTCLPSFDLRLVFFSVEPEIWGEWTGASLLSLLAVSCLWSFLSCSRIFSSLVLSLLPCSVAGLSFVSSFKGGERDNSPHLLFCVSS